MKNNEDFEQALRECWRAEQGAMADSRPDPSPNFRHNFTKAFRLGEVHVQYDNTKTSMRFKRGLFLNFIGWLGIISSLLCITLTAVFFFKGDYERATFFAVLSMWRDLWGNNNLNLIRK